MANNRSNQYDWFKGSNNKGKGGKGVDFKVGWKFTKIFLMFSLFFFTMWGCVQTFTHKTSPKLGSGVEIVEKDLYNPTRYNVSVDQSSKTFPGDSTPTTIYDITFPTHNNTLFEGNLLNKVRDQFNSDSGFEVGDWTNNYGKNAANVVLKFQKNGKDINDKTKGWEEGVLLSDKKILGYSTAQKKSNYNSPEATWFNNLKFLKVTISPDGTTATISESDQNLLLTGDKIMTAFNKLSNDGDFSAQQKAKYNLNVTKRVLDEIVFKNSAQKETTYNDNLKLIYDDLMANKKNRNPNIKEKVDAYNRMVGIAFTSIGGIHVEDGKTVALKDSIMVGGMGKTNSIIITSWDQAWTSRGFGPFYGIFVYPVAKITDLMINSMGYLKGWETMFSIILIVIVISSFMFILNFKGTMQQTRMQELSAKKAVIDAKYASYKGNKQMEARQRQEVSDLYKKEGISPLGSLSTILITMPFFLAMWRVIGTNQHIKATTWLGINFSATSYKEFFANVGSIVGWTYVPLMLLAAGLQVFSQFYPKLLTKRRDKTRINVQQKAAMKKSNKTQNIMMFVFAFMALIFTAGIQVYFIIRSLWRIVEVSITHQLIKRNKQKKITAKR